MTTHTPTSTGSVCPDCGGRVDPDGDTLEDNDCPMAGYGWTHPDDCETCGRVVCDRSC